MANTIILAANTSIIQLKQNKTLVTQTTGTATADPVARLDASAAFAKANAANTLAQSAYDAANAAGSSALTQAAFNKANTANVTAEAAYSKANSANSLAQSAYDKANTPGYTNANVANYLPTYGGNVNAITVFSNTNIAIQGKNWVQLQYNPDGTPHEQVSIGTGSWFYLDSSGAAFESNTTGSVKTLQFSNNGDVVASGNITGVNIIGNGSQLTNIPPSIVANSGFNKANAANVLAQAAFDAANTKLSATGGTLSGDVTVTGNLTIIGNTVYANTEKVLIKDNIITLNAAISQSGTPASNAGIEVDRGTLANSYLLWDETGDRWVFSNDGVTYYPIADGDRLNSAFSQANAANILAQSAYDYANNLVSGGSSIDNYARSKANAANVLAQAAFDAANSAGSTVTGNTINLGSNTVGQLISNAVTLTTSTKVTDGLALLNNVLGKLVPASPTAFPGSTTLSINSLSTYRMTNFAQTDRTTTGGKSVAGGSTVTSVRRASSYTTNTFNDLGPGDSGTITIFKNNVATGNVTFTSASANSTNGEIIVTDSKDYALVTGAAAGFWRSFDVQGSGTVSSGWNEIYIAHTGAGNTTTVSWYYDASAPGTPTFTSASMVPLSEVLYYSSTVPHYTSSTTFKLGANVSKLSGDMFPTSNTFLTGTAGGAFSAPASNTYSGVGITYPLAQNLYVSSGNVTVNTTASVISGFGSSSTGPSITVDNSYNTGTQVFTTALANTVLYKTGNTSSNTVIAGEDNIFFGSTVGVGSGVAARIVNPGSTDTPAQSASASLFNSQSGTLQSYDATLVAGVLKHDQTNYASGYLPVGPNLSSGRTGAQYFTFKFVRTSVSKFDIQFTGTIAGMWVALPGSSIDTAAAATNGWIDMSIAYGGSGVPSSGASVGGVVTLNSSVTNHRKTCTFGTVSSSSTATNEIYVRIKLTSGQTVTALSLQAPSN